MKSSSKKEKQNIFIRIPKSIYFNETLNDTEKYVYGALLSIHKLFWNRGIPVNTARLSKQINVSQRLIQMYIKSLKSKGLLQTETMNGSRRIFLFNLDDDAYVLIPDEMVKDTRLSVPYKVSYGLAFVTMDGYTYSNFSELKNKLQLSASSVYRHLHILSSIGYIKRDISASGYRFLAMDHYSTSHREKKLLKPEVKIYKTGERASERTQKAPPRSYPDDVDMILDKIWKQIR